MKKSRFSAVFAISCGALLGLFGCSTDSGGGVDAGADAAGGADGSIAGVPKLFINEVVAKASPSPSFNPTGSDWLELYNAGDAEIDLQSYRLIDSAKKGFDEALPLPPGTKIASKGFLVVFFNSDGNGSPVIQKGLAKDEAASLFHPSGLLIDRVNWEDGDAPEGLSWGRQPDGSDALKTLTKPTPGAANE